MDYQITTTYCREDIEGFYDAYLAGKKSIRISKKIMRFITTLIAVAFWGFAAVVLIANLSTKSLQIMIGSVPLTMVFVLLGLWMFSIGRRGFRSKASWKAYPFKGEQLVFHFSNDSFTLTQRNSETKISYAGIVRLYEDKFCFYLFTSPQNANILPKRDFGTAIDSFRKDITAATNLPMESFDAFRAKIEQEYRYCEYLSEYIEDGMCYDIQMICAGYIKHSALEDYVIDDTAIKHCAKCRMIQK